MPQLSKVVNGFGGALGSACLIVFALLLASSFGFGQNFSRGWLWQNPIPQGNQLLTIHFASDKRTGIAAGLGGTILKTEDGGFTWENQAARTNASLTGVFVKDVRNAIVVGARGTILFTSDGGKTWK